MTTDLIIAFLAYALVTSITPGPNNTMLLASGLNYGFIRTLPHMLGITTGFAIMVLSIGAGLGGLFVAWPWTYTGLRVVGAMYLLWLAWKIATACPMDGENAPGKPLGFWRAVAFQWVNPKAWIMSVGGIASYAPVQEGMPVIGVMTLLFAVVGLPSSAVWAGFGTTLRHWLTEPRQRRVFNIGMALLLVLSLYPMLTSHVP